VCWSRSRYREWESAERRRPDPTWVKFEEGTREPAPSEPIVAREGEEEERREEVWASR
jgi:hypothetical protein